MSLYIARSKMAKDAKTGILRLSIAEYCLLKAFYQSSHISKSMVDLVTLSVWVDLVEEWESGDHFWDLTRY